MTQAQALTHRHKLRHTGTSTSTGTGTDTLTQARVTIASRALKPIYQHQEHHHHLEMSVDGFEEAALDLQVTMGPLPASRARVATKSPRYLTPGLFFFNCEALNITRNIIGPLNIKVWDDVKILMVDEVI